jgi:spore coat polysaccharide biosynthesis predicted glycosyltransferase SpsG
MHLKKSLAFRVDFNNEIGLGHIQRCLNLAEILRKNGWKVLFICKSTSEQKKINFKRFKVFFIQNSLSEKNDGIITKNILKKNFTYILVIDRDHLINKKYKKEYFIFLKEVRDIKIVFAWEPFIWPNFNYNYIYHPYIGAKKIIKNKSKNTITGEKYLIVNKKFFFSRKIKKNIKNILINLGGANNLHILKKILINFFSYKDLFKINIVIFSNTISNNFLVIKKIIKKKKLNVNFIINPQKIYNLYKKADIGIFGSGYSKYEASASGLPILIIQRKKSDFLFNRFFIKKRSSFLIKNLNNKSILNNVTKNFTLRKKMSKNGLKILSLNNKNNVVFLFNKVVNCNYGKISN